jgi:hypothetical protein
MRKSRHCLAIVLLSSSALAQQPVTLTGRGDADPPRLNFNAPIANAPASESGTGLAAPEAASSSSASFEARLKALEEAGAERKPKSEFPKFSLSAYAQPQFITVFTNAAASLNAGGGGAIPPGFRNVGGSGALPVGIDPNDVTPREDGTTTNTTVFRIRRARFKAMFEPTSYARILFEIEAFPIGTGTSNVRHALASGILHWSDDVTTEFAAGITRLPVTLELQQSSKERPFIERSVAIRTMFPGDTDVGIFTKTTALKKKLRLDLGLVNGVTVGEPRFAQLPDLDRGKDGFGVASYALGPLTALVSFYGGTGDMLDFKRGIFASYKRYAFNIGLDFQHTFSEKLGQTRAVTEFKLAHNLDRGLVYPFAAPSLTSPSAPVGVQDRNGRAFFFRVEQELGKHVLAGVRYDHYLPDVQVDDNSYHGLGALAALRVGEALRWSFEYLYASDHAHAEGQPVPNREFHVLSSHLQVRYD